MLVKDEMMRAKSLSYKMYSAEYAYINTTDGVFKTSSEPFITDDHGGLKDVTYVIYEGALYISGIKSIWRYIAWGDSLTWHLNLYRISESEFNDLIIPEECVIRDKRWGIFRRKFKYVIDINKNPNRYWFERKHQPEFTMALHPYKIVEN